MAEGDVTPGEFYNSPECKEARRLWREDEEFHDKPFHWSKQFKDARYAWLKRTGLGRT